MRCLEDGKIDKPELLAICTDILQQLKIEQNLDFLLNNYAEIPPLKTKAEYEALLPNKGEGMIEKCGILSLFEVQKQNIINDYEGLISNFKAEEITLLPISKTLTSVPTDPSQQYVLEATEATAQSPHTRSPRNRQEPNANGYTHQCAAKQAENAGSVREANRPRGAL